MLSFLSDQGHSSFLRRMNPNRLLCRCRISFCDSDKYCKGFGSDGQDLTLLLTNPSYCQSQLLRLNPNYKVPK